MLQRKLTDLVVLVIMDGWGIAPAGPGNAISQANLPNYNRFLASYPHTQLRASGEAVGLPRGEVGNTETGHLNIGAGRIVYQDLARINMSIADGSFFQNKTLVDAINHAKNNNSKLHIMGLVGAGGVHSNIEHLFALIELAKRQNFTNVFIHIFTDGRDSPPRAALTYIKQLKDVIAKEGVGTIASIMGRYWAMDRDQRWDRTAKAYFALTKGDGIYANSVEEAVETSYAENKSDEFIEPTVIADPNGNPTALISENDAVVFFNFRIDRPRQLSRAFVLKDVASANMDWGFDPYAIKYQKKHDPKKEPPPVVIHRGSKINNLFFVTMTEYEKPLVREGAVVAFPPENIVMPLGQVIATNNFKQLRASESEKERFVSFYFNGQAEKPFLGEDRLVVPSPDVATYDLKPEMSASQLTDDVMKKITSVGSYSFVLVNYANADMVGHTGNITAAIKGVEMIDQCLDRLSKFVVNLGGIMLITADHGNAEEMINLTTGEVDTEHSGFPVPFIVVGNQFAGKNKTMRLGILADIAPTILGLLGISIPGSMTGRSFMDELLA